MKKKVVLFFVFAVVYLLSFAQVITDEDFHVSKPLSYLMKDGKRFQAAPESLYFSITMKNGSPHLRLYSDFSSVSIIDQETDNEWTFTDASIIEKSNVFSKIYSIQDPIKDNVYATCVETNGKWGIVFWFAFPVENNTQQSKTNQIRSSWPSTFEDTVVNTFTTDLYAEYYLDQVVKDDWIDDDDWGEVVEEDYEEEEPPVRFVEKMPEFPGGMSAMKKYISENTQYPDAAREAGAMGTVLVEFVVEKDGSVTNAKVVVSQFPALDEEALRVVRSFPKWKPGESNGRKVRVYYNVPIRFDLL